MVINRKRFYKILTILLIVSSMSMFSSCNYKDLPPKTNDASTDYILPKGELPSNEEKAEVQAIRAEYNNSIKE